MALRCAAGLRRLRPIFAARPCPPHSSSLNHQASWIAIMMSNGARGSKVLLAPERSVPGRGPNQIGRGPADHEKAIDALERRQQPPTRIDPDLAIADSREHGRRKIKRVAEVRCGL